MNPKHLIVVGIALTSFTVLAEPQKPQTATPEELFIVNELAHPVCQARLKEIKMQQTRAAATQSHWEGFKTSISSDSRLKMIRNSIPHLEHYPPDVSRAYRRQLQGDAIQKLVDRLHAIASEKGFEDTEFGDSVVYIQSFTFCQDTPPTVQKCSSKNLISFRMTPTQHNVDSLTLDSENLYIDPITWEFYAGYADADSATLMPLDVGQTANEQTLLSSFDKFCMSLEPVKMPLGEMVMKEPSPSISNVIAKAKDGEFVQAIKMLKGWARSAAQ